MFCTTSETEGQVGTVKFVTVPFSKAVALLWISVACSWCQSFGDFSLMYNKVSSGRFTGCLKITWTFFQIAIIPVYHVETFFFIFCVAKVK